MTTETMQAQLPNGRVHVGPAQAQFDAAGIYVDGELVLTTALETGDPAQHNELARRIAELLRRGMST